MVLERSGSEERLLRERNGKWYAVARRGRGLREKNSVEEMKKRRRRRRRVKVRGW